MPVALPEGSWALILGGSSGFGLATAHKLAEHGMNLCLVHRDRRGAMRADRARVREDPRARRLAAHLQRRRARRRAQGRRSSTQLAAALGERRQGAPAAALDRLRQPEAARAGGEARARRRAAALAASARHRRGAAGGGRRRLFAEGLDELARAGLAAAATRPRPSSTTTTSRRRSTAWARACSAGRRSCIARGLFADDARVFGLTSEGNEVAWKGYAAVSAAKVALESLPRSIAVEFAPYGVRSNVIQAGVTDTPALPPIPGSAQLKAAGAAAQSVRPPHHARGRRPA